MPVLVLITRVIHRSKLHFAVAQKTKSIKVILGEKIEVESVEHIEQYHIKFVETSHYLNRRGRKEFVESLFSQSKFASQSNGFVHFST